MFSWFLESTFKQTEGLTRMETLLTAPNTYELEMLESNLTFFFGDNEPF